MIHAAGARGPIDVTPRFQPSSTANNNRGSVATIRYKINSMICMARVAFRGWRHLVRLGTMPLACCVLLVGLLGPAQKADSQTFAQASSPSAQRGFLDKYCVRCHNQRLKTAGLLLDLLDVTNVAASAEVWEKVIKKVRSGAMPPAGAPRPDPASADRLVSWLERTLEAAALAHPNPGRTALHRLNRTEYANAIRDLLGLDIDVAALLPPDDAGYGFDNIGDVLTITPGLLERYLLAAKEIARTAIGDASIRPVTHEYRLPLSLIQDIRMSEDLPFGTRGGLAVRHTFPADGEYEIAIDLQRNQLALGNRIRGGNDGNVIDVLLDGELVKRFTVGRRGGLKTAGRRGAAGDVALQLRFQVRAGAHLLGVAFVDTPWYMEGVGVSRLPAASDGYSAGTESGRDYGKIQMGIDSVTVSGPFNSITPEDSPPRSRILTCRPATAHEEAPCASAILSRLAKRAFRRPVSARDLETLMAFYESGHARGGFDTGIQRAIERLLVSPSFLVRVEGQPANVAPGQAYRISDLDLASRLSFFLWSSVPDDQLIDLAAVGRLHDSGVLDHHVQRMLADPRFDALVTNFFGQWLSTRNVPSLTPDPHTFPEFDANLQDAFRRETELFLSSQVREDRSVVELLTANYTFLNERLARHYGIPNVYGMAFRRVTYADETRAGLLGHGSILMVTSYPNRTSVVQRGKWILENLLGVPPPPPPANVPPLEENDETTHAKTQRQRLEQHRKNPACATCHAKMDPLGFALENFNAIGGFRTTDAGSRIDPSGVFIGGATFADPAEFRRALLGHQEEFVETLVVKLLTYAMGRGVEYYDMPAVRAIMRGAAARNYRWSAIISGIVQSTPFQMRSGE